MHRQNSVSPHVIMCGTHFDGSPDTLIRFNQIALLKNMITATVTVTVTVTIGLNKGSLSCCLGKK